MGRCLQKRREKMQHITFFLNYFRFPKQDEQTAMRTRRQASSYLRTKSGSSWFEGDEQQQSATTVKYAAFRRS